MPAVRGSPCASRSKDGKRSLTVAALIGAATVRERLAFGRQRFLGGSRASAWPANIKPALAEPAVPRSSPERPHHRIAPGAWSRKHDVLPETARAAQFAGHEMYRFTDNHYPEV